MTVLMTLMNVVQLSSAQCHLATVSWDTLTSWPDQLATAHHGKMKQCCRTLLSVKVETSNSGHLVTCACVILD